MHINIIKDSILPQHLLVNQQYQDGASALSEACSLIEANGGPKQTLHRAFYMIVQVTHLLNAGLVITIDDVCILHVHNVIITDKNSQTPYEAASTMCQTS